MMLTDKSRAALAEFQRIVNQMIEDAANYVVQLLPFMAKGFAAGGGLAGATIAVYSIWENFGQDPAALILGFAIGIVPFVYAMGLGKISFGGLLASGAVSALVGLLFLILPLFLCNLLILITLATLIVLQMSRRDIQPELQNETL